MAPQVLLQASPGWFCLEFRPTHQKPISSSSFPMNPASSQFPYHTHRNHYLCVYLGWSAWSWFFVLSYTLIYLPVSQYCRSQQLHHSPSYYYVKMKLFYLLLFSLQLLTPKGPLSMDLYLLRDVKATHRVALQEGYRLTELFPVSWALSVYDYGNDPWISLSKHFIFQPPLQLAIWLRSSQWNGNRNAIILFHSWHLKASQMIPHISLCLCRGATGSRWWGATLHTLDCRREKKCTYIVFNPWDSMVSCYNK